MSKENIETNMNSLKKKKSDRERERVEREVSMYQKQSSDLLTVPYGDDEL